MHQRCWITPPTMLRTTLLGAPFKRGGTDPIHDADLLLVDLDLLHQGPDDLPSRVPVRLLQPLRDAPRELLQLADHQPQFRLLGGLADPLPMLVLQLGQALPRRRDPRLEFRLVEQPVAVGIDQSRNHLFYITHQLAEMLHLLTRARLRPLQPPLVLRPDPLGLGQEAGARLPRRRRPAYRCGSACSSRGAGRRSDRRRSPCSGSRRRGPCLALGRGPARRLAVAAVAAPLADDQALEQVTAAAGPVATALPVLLELSLDRPEEVLAHQPGDINEDLIFRRCIDP